MRAPAPQTLVGWMAATAAGQPDRPALHGDGETWSWRRFWDRAGEVAASVAAVRGFAPGRAVALIGANEPDYIAAYFGILRAGAVVVPLNPMLTADELVIQAGFADLLGTMAGDVDPLRMEALATVAPVWPLARLAPDRSLHEADLGADTPACILLTSGSTGRAKGVVHTQGTLLHAALQIAITFPFAPDERSVGFLPFFASIPEQVLPTLVAGGAIDCIRRFDEERVCAACADGATSFDAVPTVMARLLDSPGADRMRGLRWVMFASEPMPGPLLERWWDALPDVGAHQLYGMTEMLTISHAPHQLLRRHPQTVGRPYATSTVQVVDPDGAPLPAGTAGQVTCRSPALMQGYLNDAQATADALTPGGAIRTGDLGVFDEGGRLRLIGRLKDLIISSGMNIAPAEIELVACRHPRVAAAAVVGIPHDRWGETPVVVVVPAAGNTLTAGDVLDFCRRELSSYKRPTAAALVDSLPQTGIGKTAKAELRERLLNGDIPLVHAS
jgi:acyl-CoA synthetase (AMP-forming)/AMP-acid ligase II